MKKQQNPVVFKLLVLLFMAAFVAGSFANMLCIPRYVPDNAATHVAGRRAFESNCSRASFIQLFDRSIIDDTVIAESTFSPKTLDLIPDRAYLQVAENDILPPRNQTLYSYQYSYLSYCSFRI